MSSSQSHTLSGNSKTETSDCSSYSAEIMKLKEKIQNQKNEISDLKRRLEISTKMNQELNKSDDSIPEYTNLWKDKFYSEKEKVEGLEKTIRTEKDNNTKICKMIVSVRKENDKNKAKIQEFLSAASNFTGLNIDTMSSFLDFFNSTTLSQHIKSATSPLEKLTNEMQQKEEKCIRLKAEIRSLKNTIQKQNEKMLLEEKEFNKTVSKLKEQISYQNETLLNEEPKYYTKETKEVKEPRKNKEKIAKTENKAKKLVLIHFGGVSILQKHIPSEKEEEEFKELLELRRKNKKLNKRVLELENQKDVFKSAVQKQRCILDNKSKEEVENGEKMDEMRTVLKNSCKKSDLKNALMVISSQKEKIFYYKQKIEESKGERESYIEHISILEDELEKNRKKLNSISKNASQAQQKNLELNEQISKLKENLQTSQEKINELSRRKEKITLNTEGIPDEAVSYINEILENDSFQLQSKFEMCVKKIVEVYSSMINTQEEECNDISSDNARIKAKVGEFISTVSQTVLGFSISFDSFMTDPFNIETIIRRIKQRFA